VILFTVGLEHEPVVRVELRLLDDAPAGDHVMEGRRQGQFDTSAQPNGMPFTYIGLGCSDIGRDLRLEEIARCAPAVGAVIRVLVRDRCGGSGMGSKGRVFRRGCRARVSPASATQRVRTPT